MEAPGSTFRQLLSAHRTQRTPDCSVTIRRHETISTQAGDTAAAIMVSRLRTNAAQDFTVVGTGGVEFERIGIHRPPPFTTNIHLSTIYFIYFYGTKEGDTPKTCRPSNIFAF
jgi:hypothetical protein